MRGVRLAIICSRTAFGLTEIPDTLGLKGGPKAPRCATCAHPFASLRISIGGELPLAKP
jgi:hypothetical protein